MSVSQTMHDLIEKLVNFEPPAFVMGGLAENVLLGAGLGGPHHDLDLLAPAGALDRLLAQLRAAGIGEWRTVLTEAAGQPLLLRAAAGELEVEVYTATPQPDGGFSFEVPAQGPAPRLRLFTPPDTFEYPASRVDGLTLRTLSPWALALMRASSAQTRHAHNAEKRAKDLAKLAELRRAFLTHLDEAQLQPRIVPLDV